MRKVYLTRGDEVTLVDPLGRDDVAAVVGMLEHQYWNVGIPADVLARAHLGSTVWVGARTADGGVIASARAISDGAKCAWIYDVVVADGWRGRGVGRELLRWLLDRPALRDVRSVWLGTRDAQEFYRREGFVDRRERPRPWPTSDMVLMRG